MVLAHLGGLRIGTQVDNTRHGLELRDHVLQGSESGRVRRELISVGEEIALRVAVGVGRQAKPGRIFECRGVGRGRDCRVLLDQDAHDIGDPQPLREDDLGLQLVLCVNQQLVGQRGTHALAHLEEPGL